MQNGAYSLAFLSTVSGLVLLMISKPGSSLYPSLGTVLLLVAVLLAGIGKGIEWLGYVKEGALDSDDTDDHR